MNKTILNYFLIVLIITSCKNKVATNTETQSTTQPTTLVAAQQPNVFEKILGSFVGAFGDNKITILITKANSDTVSGRSVVGGNDRPFVGIVNFKDNKYTINAKEPGDAKHDGTFDFTIDAANTDLIQGTWSPFKKEVTPKKEYVLQRKAFKYDINVGNYAKASQRLLKESDVENYTKWDLETMRNEIFARHGYCFKKKDLRDYFENEDWYVPNTVNVSAELTEIEKKNIALIKRYEKYADEYGDEFGR
jgi:hypothetical protein